MTPNQDIRREMHLRLREKGLTVEGWARQRDSTEGVASKAVSRYVGKDKRPTSWRAKEIIEGLEEVTGLQLCG
jgi:hypothetical protein